MVSPLPICRLLMGLVCVVHSAVPGTGKGRHVRPLGLLRNERSKIVDGQGSKMTLVPDGEGGGKELGLRRIES